MFPADCRIIIRMSNLNAGLIDFRSDMLTQLTPVMREAIAKAEVGDDPTCACTWTARVLWNAAVAAGLSIASLGTAAEFILSSNAPAPLRFARQEIQRASEGKRVPDISLEISGSGDTQSYRFQTSDGRIRVVGADPVGAMYGGLEVAEAIRLGTVDELSQSARRPFIARRGIKFNIPLDLRTPSYSDNSDAAQANIPEMWSREFWREFLDEMARHRFNVLSLWSLNPFPSIVKVPEYPDVALADVLRGRRDCFDQNFPHSGERMFRPEFLAGAEVVRRLSIEEKIQFWRDVLQMAQDRGVEVYWFTWNAFIHTEEGKHGIRRSQPDGEMLRYFRASVRETVKTYPLLAGMGITAGESMEEPMGRMNKEEWLWNAYGEGIRDALKEQPGRQFRLIHRFHMTGLDQVTSYWKDYPGPFDFSYKYAVAHMYGLTNPPFIAPLLPELSSTRRTWLTVRNDDIYSFRWGDPQFARGFISAMPGPDKVAGFYMGPDGYCWGREAMDHEPESPRQLVMKKQWFSFLLWGRLSYDPAIPDRFFERVLAARFPEVPAGTLLEAWSAASRVVPETTRFIWGNIDLRWLPEACISHPTYKGFYSVRHFIEGEGMPGSGNLTIREWREHLLSGRTMDGVTPLQVAANLRRHAGDAMKGVERMRPRAGTNKELRLTLGDIEAFARLGEYYAAKIEGACELALYDGTQERGHQLAAIVHLESALRSWQAYAAAYVKQYRQPLLYNRVGIVDIPTLAGMAALDVQMAREWKPGTVGKAPARKSGGSKFGQ
ncbi:MAG: carbohydrate-binding family 6 protein [Candidatus Hydrogenedentes bacterium]|nr:carbohydrate-binding family 6 protein [Candidatus Hydrogenedentota bacterium]